VFRSSSDHPTQAPIPIAAAIYLVLTYASKRFPNGRSLLAMRPNWILWCETSHQ
jgi:hypothetical protein